MKKIQNFIFLIFIFLILIACGSSKINKEKPVVIANDSLSYEVIIIDNGFNLYLNSVAQPRKYYSQQYLESRNYMFVTTWNIRAQNPLQFNPNIYENTIDYTNTIDYGYEVNYLLFNYFMFAQQKYKMSLNGGFNNRIR